ncbi:hypothetical protein ABZ404_36860 [Streptomyces sp. NPDC005878]|uniref:DUF6197 family protein n=1 Tax=Streptomyces sp. NPDC005878 TaxID=3157077 RepID=UPI0033EDADBB
MDTTARRTPPSAPARPRPLTPRSPARPAAPAAPVVPSWGERLLPAAVRHALADLDWWQHPAPQPPSLHLLQVVTVLRRYGWCRSLDVTVTGRMCQRGAMNLLQKTGHVTPRARARAEHYLALALAEHGVTMHYTAWNDLPDQTLASVEERLIRAAHLARQNGE